MTPKAGLRGWPLESAPYRFSGRASALPYWYRNASIGSMRAARRAGKIPERTPTAQEMRKEIAIDQAGTAGDQPGAARRAPAPPTPGRVPGGAPAAASGRGFGAELGRSCP